MSWYNSSDSSFIDATQTFESGGIIGNNLIVNEGDVKTDNLGFNSTISDLISLKFENGLFNLYLNNKNENGLIFLNTSENDNKIKIENGKLYLYYDYDFTNAPTITSGWTDIINYSTSLQNQIFTLGANVALIDSTLYTPVTGLNVRFPIVEASVATATSINITQDSKITQLELDMNTLITNRPQILEYNIDYDEALDNIRDTMGQNTTAYQNALRDVAVSGGATFNTARSLALSRANFATSFFNSILAGVGGLSFIAGVIFAIYDRLNDRNLIHEEERLLLTYEKIKDNPDSLINNLIHLNGLQINELTNTGFITSEIYDVDINNGGKLKIQIKNINNELKALILDLSTTTTGFNVNDIITIPKTNLGGGTGNLEILVISLVNQKELISEKLDYIYTQKNILKNNDRRRQNIPNKNDFTDGLEIIETTTTEESGEILDKIEIKLKLDQNQFEYDANGNLQVKNYTIISDNASDITTIQNTIGTPEDNKETATIYGNIAKNVYDIDNLETNVFYKGFITDFGANSKFQLNPIYDENNNIINYKLDSTLLENVRDALGTRNPLDTQTAFEKITANKADIETNTADIQTNKDDIVDLRTDLNTQTGRIDDMRLVLGYDDNSILHLILPLNELGETPSIEANLINNNGLLDLGYKKNDLANNYDDYFNLFFALPKLHTTNTTITGAFTENLILNGISPTNANITFVTDYDNLKSDMKGTFNFEITNNNLCISLMAKISQLTDFKNLLFYNGITAYIKNDTIKLNYSKIFLNTYTILNSTFADGAIYTDLNYYDNRYTYRISRTDHKLINYIDILDSTNYTYVNIDIFTSTSFRGYKLTNIGDSVEIFFKHDVVIKNINLVLKRFWTYGWGFTETPFQVYAKLNIFIRDNINDPWVQILQNDYAPLGFSQYQGLKTFNISDQNQNLSCRFLSISFEYSAPPIRTSHSELELCYLNIPNSHTISEYGNDEAVLPIQSNNEYTHLVYNHSQNTKSFNFIVDGVERNFNLTDYNELITNQLVIGDNELLFRMLGIGNTYHTNPEIIQDIRDLNDTSLRVNIDGLTQIEDLYVKDNLLVNKLEFISGNEIISFAPSVEESSGRRRALITDTTYTLLDEIIIPTPPTENSFLYYDVNAGNISTRSDVVRTADISDVVRTADISDVVRDNDILDVVRDNDILDVVRDNDILDIVRTANIQDVVRTDDILDVVRDNDILDVVRTANIQDVVRTDDISDVVRTDDILDVVRDADILDVVRDADILDVVRDADISDVVRDADISDVVRTANIQDVVRTADISDVVRTADLNTAISGINQYTNDDANALLATKAI
jgi:hypothetical protein